MVSRSSEHDLERMSADFGSGDTYHEIIRRRLSRRGLLKAGVVVSALAAAGPAFALTGGRPAYAVEDNPAPTLTCQVIPPDTTDEITVPPGYRSQVVIRWGDPLFGDAPPFDLQSLTVQGQERQLGYNCDFVMYLPLPAGSSNPNEGLLWVNHEYTDPRMMYFGFNADAPQFTREQVDIQIAAHGGSVVHVRQQPDGSWSYAVDSPHNRRVTANTVMMITGPAAGHELMKTADDPTGTRVVGTFANCGGGLTPWGTVLIAEENFQDYFSNFDLLPEGNPNKAQLKRYSIPATNSVYRWEQHHDRFDVSRSPNEPNRFGWMVEIDPYDASFVPAKRTALGRFKHEAAASR
jgi:secreted PhoX family phosphatase